MRILYDAGDIFELPKNHNEAVCVTTKQLIDICEGRGITSCYLTRPGCALGGLDWESQVRPLLEPILDDRFIIADYQL